MKRYIDDGTWVYMPGVNDENGFRFKLLESRGKYFALMFSDQTEIRNPGNESIISTDINKLMGPVFQRDDIAGIMIDPYTTGLCLEKVFLQKCIDLD